MPDCNKKNTDYAIIIIFWAFGASKHVICGMRNYYVIHNYIH